MKRAISKIRCGTALDLVEFATVFAAVAELPEDFSDISILVNNAGVGLGLEPAHKARLGVEKRSRYEHQACSIARARFARHGGAVTWHIINIYSTARPITISGQCVRRQ